MRSSKLTPSKKLQPSVFSRLLSSIGMMPSTKSLSRKRTATNVSQYSVLEPKNLLASVSFSGGEITINGNTGNDNATVSISGSDVRVVQPGLDTESFAVSSVTSIVFIGRAGNDFFENTTAIPSRAFGQAGNDTLIGGSGDDTLAGNVGNDIIRGNGGVDRLIAGNGDDNVEGGAGNDTILGTAGLNTLRGDTGDDLIFGGNDVDTIFGGDGDDQLSGNGADDTIRGGDGADSVNAGPGNDDIDGEGGNDRLYGQAGDDTVVGGAGNDTVGGNGGNDTLSGGTGNDLLSAGLGDDALSGGDGNDRLFVIAGNNTLNGGGGTDKAEYTTRSDDFQVKRGTSNRIESLDFRDTITVDGDVVTTFGDRNLISADVENAFFPGIADGTPTASSINVDEAITVRPIVASNSNGSNTAEFLGNAEEAADIQARIDRIFSVAGIDVVWESTRTTNNTSINVGTGGGTRSTSDLDTIVSQGDSSGLGSSDANVVDAYFVERVPGFIDLPDNNANGLAFQGQSGLAVHVGDDLVGFEAGRAAVARVIAHEIAHNMGLVHVSGSSNLMTTPASTDALTGAQRSTILSSSITRPVAGSGTSVEVTLPDEGLVQETSSSPGEAQVGSSTTSTGGCGGCGVCGPCTGGTELTGSVEVNLPDEGFVELTDTSTGDAEVDSSTTSTGGCGGCGVCGPCTGGIALS